MIDTGLLNKALEAIELHPEQHYQGTWRCSTGQCLAGWVGVITGAQWTDPEDYHNAYVDNPDFNSKDDDAYCPWDKSVHVSDYAQYMLGDDTIRNLTKEEYYRLYPGVDPNVYDEVRDGWRTLDFGLFSGANTREQLRVALSIIEERQSK